MERKCPTCKFANLVPFLEPCCSCADHAQWVSADTSSPDYYHKGGIECFQAIDAATADLTGPDAFDIGNAVKYLWRWKDKGGVDDLRKAVTYLQRAIDRNETIDE